jgi:ABC-2 type transport system permease protein
MNVFKAILKRELSSYFATPIALIFLTVFLILTGFFTFKLGGFYEQGQADLRTFFVWHPWLYLFIVPAVSMRLWAEERRTGTIELLLTLPVTLQTAMLGKFFAAWIFLGLALVLTFPIVFTVMYLGDPDIGVILAGYLGSYLMAGAFLAIGCCLSACTSNQVISFVLSTFVCLIFILVGSDPVVRLFEGLLSPTLVSQLVNLSFPFHFEAIQRGVINMTDLVYFVSVMVVFLYAGTIILERKKAD